MILDTFFNINDLPSILTIKIHRHAQNPLDHLNSGAEPVNIWRSSFLIKKKVYIQFIQIFT